MQHPYLVWKPEYEKLLQTMVVVRTQAVDVAAQHIMAPANWSRYLAVEAQTKVPAAFIGALDFRESNCNPHCGLGQGDPWDEVSRHVPRGCGPFAGWVPAAIFYVHYDHLDDNSAPWSLAYECWKGEIWNGLGYRYHGIPSPYLWAGTNHQLKGKYTADGQYDHEHMDTQLGIMPIIVRIGELMPDHAQPLTAGPIVIPDKFGPNLSPVQWVQRKLNELHMVPPELAPLQEDGNYGRRTREAVRAFQRLNGLEPDGLCGPKTASMILRLDAAERV